MSVILTDTLKARVVGAAVTTEKGLNVGGACTATSFVGNVTGNASGSSGSCSGNAATATVATNAQGLTGTPDITVRNVTGVAATFTGVLTYEDVTNVDSVGIVTARGGLEIGAAGVGGTITAVGNAILSGITTVAGGTFYVKGGEGSAGQVHIYSDEGDDNADKWRLLKSGGDNQLKIQNYQSGSWENGIILHGEGAFEAYNDNSKKFETVSTGCSVYGNLATNGDFTITGDSTNSIQLRVVPNEKNLVAVANGAVEIYFDNSKKLETTSSGAITTGIHTVTVGTDLLGYKVEEGSFDTNALNGEFDFELENGHVQTHTGSTAGTYFPDFRVSSSQSLSSVMDVGDVISATLIVTASNTSHYCTAGIKIDNSTSNVTVEWIGSSAPSAGKGAGYDIYSFTIQKTAATPAYLVIVNSTDAG